MRRKKPDQSFQLMVPYVRLTKNEFEQYTLWIVVFLPKNYIIKVQPQPKIVSDTEVQVDVNVEGPEKCPSKKWGIFPIKVSMPTPINDLTTSASINVTVLLDDPEDEGSTTVKYKEAEQE